jgi:hypothetical protein
VLWGGLRIAYLLLQLGRSCIFYLEHDVPINNIIAWLTPGIFAAAALGTGQTANVSSHYCGPTLEYGGKVVWIPLLTYAAISIVLLISAVIKIEKVPAPSTRMLLTVELDEILWDGQPQKANLDGYYKIKLPYGYFSHTDSIRCLVRTLPHHPPRPPLIIDLGRYPTLYAFYLCST